MFNDNEQSSSCMQVQKKLIKIDKTDKWAQLHLWDTLGQEQYKSLSPLYFRKAVGVFLVFDCTSIESFKACDSWFEQMSQTVDSRILIMLLGNKSDLPQREVPYNMAMDYARKRNFGYLEVSAKSGANIKNAFNCLVREIHRIRMQVKDDPTIDQINTLEKIDGNMRQKGKSIKINSELHKEEEEMDDENSPDKKGRKAKKPKKEKCLKC